MPDRIRTYDLQLRRLALYPTELRAQIRSSLRSFDVAIKHNGFPSRFQNKSIAFKGPGAFQEKIKAIGIDHVLVLVNANVNVPDEANFMEWGALVDLF